jgi:hypothetical protein
MVTGKRPHIQSGRTKLRRTQTHDTQGSVKATQELHKYNKINTYCTCELPNSKKGVDGVEDQNSR